MKLYEYGTVIGYFLESKVIYVYRHGVPYDFGENKSVAEVMKDFPNAMLKEISLIPGLTRPLPLKVKVRC